MKNEKMYRYQLELNNGKTYVLDSRQSNISKLLMTTFSNDGWLTVSVNDNGEHSVVRASSVVSIRFVGKA